MIGTGLSAVVWFDADVTIDGRSESLLATQVLFCGLNTDMAEQELNLFQFTARDVTQTGACAPKVMGRNVAEMGSGRKFPDYVADDFLGNSGAPYRAIFGHTPE